MMIFDCKKSRVQFETLYKMDEEHSWICTLYAYVNSGLYN